MIVLLAACSVGLVCAGVAAMLVRPMPRIAARVRPYTVVARVELGRGADLVAPTASTGVLGDGIVGRLFGPPLVAFTRRFGRIVERQGDDVLALRLRQAGIDATPEEFRSMFRVADGYDLELAALAGATDPTSAKRRQELEAKLP